MALPPPQGLFPLFLQSMRSMQARALDSLEDDSSFQQDISQLSFNPSQFSLEMTLQSIELEEMWDKFIGFVGVLDRLFPDRHQGGNFQGRDVLASMELYPEEFWYVTGETTESFYELSRLMANEGRGFKCTLSLNNQILLLLMWLRKYTSLYELGHTFQVYLFFHVVINVCIALKLVGLS